MKRRDSRFPGMIELKQRAQLPAEVRSAHLGPGYRFIKALQVGRQSKHARARVESPEGAVVAIGQLTRQFIECGDRKLDFYIVGWCNMPGLNHNEPEVASPMARNDGIGL